MTDQETTWRAIPHPLRKIVKTVDYDRKVGPWSWGGSRRYFLECGHELVAKQSAGRPRQKRCWMCSQEGKTK